MYSVNFYCRKPSSDKESPLHMFINYSGTRIKLSTGEKVFPELWDSKKQRFVTSSRTRLKYSSRIPELDSFLLGVESKLKRLESEVRKYFAACNHNNIPPDLKELKVRLMNIIKPTVYEKSDSDDITSDLEDFIQRIISGKLKQTDGENYSDGTVANYKNLLYSIKEFEKDRRVKLKWSTFNREIYTDYINWHEESGLSKNYTGKHIKDLKCLMRLSFDIGNHENDCFRSKWFSVPTEKMVKHPLSEEEIDQLYKLPLQEGTTRCKARDMFLISCFTGLRAGDVTRISPRHILETDDGKQRLSLTTQKNGHDVLIPIKKKLKKILERYNYYCPDISRQTCNRMIKKIAREAGLPKKKADNLRLHIGRHSFATNLYARGRPMVDIMQITGHKSEKNFLKYINVKPEEAASRMEEDDFFQ